MLENENEEQGCSCMMSQTMYKNTLSVTYKSLYIQI